MASPGRAASTKAGGPNGATPSRRIEPARSKPAMTRPRKRWLPTRAESANSAVKVLMPLQLEDTMACTAAASAMGVPASCGKVIRRAAHAPDRRARAAAPSSRRLLAWASARHTVTGSVGASAFFGARVVDLPADGREIHVLAVAVERLVPRGDRVVHAPTAREHVAQVVLDLGIGRHALGRRAEILLSLGQIAALEVRPAQAVEVGAVVGLGLQRLAHQLHGLVQ